MEYLVDGRKYSLSYSHLKNMYHQYINCTDDEFMAKLPEILHFSCIVSYLKELPASATVSDRAIIHQLVHLLSIPNEPLVDLEEIRSLFKEVLELA